jgi:hypothetical protein
LSASPRQTHVGKAAAANLFQVFENLFGIGGIDERREIQALARVNVALVLDGFGFAQHGLVLEVKLISNFLCKMKQSRQNKQKNLEERLVGGERGALVEKERAAGPTMFLGHGKTNLLNLRNGKAQQRLHRKHSFLHRQRRVQTHQLLHLEQERLSKVKETKREAGKTVTKTQMEAQRCQIKLQQKQRQAETERTQRKNEKAN